MNKIGNKIYYNNTSLDILWETGDRQGVNIEDTTEEFDLSLNWATDLNKEDISVIKTSYGEIEKNLKEKNANRYMLEKNDGKVEIKYFHIEEKREKTEVDLINEKINKAKLDILEAVIKMQLGTTEKINAGDVPPLTDINEMGLPSNNHIDLSNIDESSIGLIDPSLIPPPPKVD